MTSKYLLGPSLGVEPPPGDECFLTFELTTPDLWPPLLTPMRGFLHVDGLLEAI